MAATVAGAVEDGRTLTARNSSLVQRGRALVNLGTELLPVSTRDVGDGVRLAGAARDRLARSAPNPNGRVGSDHHQAHVDDIARDIEGRGLVAEREVRVSTPGGERGSRYIDVVGRDRDTGSMVEAHQVGRGTVGGLPVARERRALDDIESATGTRPEFRRYND